VKRFLQKGAAGLLVLLLCALPVWGAGGKEGASGPAASTAAAGGKYSEAPMLARLVKEGKLPSVEKRLPDAPCVAGPGVWNAAKYVSFTPGKYADGRALRTIAMDTKVSIMDISTNNFLWAPDQTSRDLMPVLVEKYSASTDYKVFDFTIRKGLKWSNGDEVTTDDVKFTFEDLYQFPDCSIAYPSNLRSQGNMLYPPAQLSIKDKYSFTLTFDRSYGWFLVDLRSWIPDSNMIMRPSKFLKAYHPKYADMAKLNAMAREAGLADWKQQLQIKADTHWTRTRNPKIQMGVPHLQAWTVVEATETRIRVERNPYFCWVDTKGQQLPYIDAIECSIIKDKDAALVKVVSGEIDYVLDDFIRLPSMPVLLQGAEKAGYNVQTSGGFNSPPLLYINQDYDYQTPDSEWQKLVQDPQRRFGKAVALSINKKDVNDSLYFGKYKMDKLITDAEYDPARANKLLDDAGLNKRDAKGLRTYPSGAPLEITIMCHGLSPDQIDMSFLIAKYLQAVGINANAKQVAPAIFNQKADNNEYQMTVMWNDGPAHASGMSQDYTPGAKGRWAPASWAYFNTGGKQGRKPPAYLQEFFDIHTERKGVPPASPEGEKLYAKLEKWFADNYVMVWPVGSIVQPNILSKKLRNLPADGYPIIFGMTEAAPTWYFDQP
jgi:peptide/nickel transport system substrate-binding protein